MKIASRLFLPLELGCGYAMMSWGLAGWVGGGALFRDLAAAGRNLEWGLILCGFALAHMAVAATEWQFGRRWENRRLESWVRARCVLSFVGVIVWLYMLYFIGTAANPELSFALWVQAPGGMFFTAWSWVGNYKVLCMLDPRIQTEGLQRTMRLERGQLLSEQ